VGTPGAMAASQGIGHASTGDQLLHKGITNSP
jgi:hypothetical protein